MNSNLMDIDKVQKEINSILVERGFFTNCSKSHTEFGDSNYITVFAPDLSRQLAKIRMSNHSVTNINRVIDEYHVRKNQTPIEVVRDLFGDNNGDKY